MTVVWRNILLISVIDCTLCWAGLGIRLEDVHLFPILFLCYGRRVGDCDDGQGETKIKIDLSNTYKFEGLWNVCGYYSLTQ
jgi:hypothetical protein